MKELFEKTVIADKNSAKRIGSLPAYMAINCSDIGTALIDGRQVYITWGRNLKKEEQEWYYYNTAYKPIYLNTNDGTSELIYQNDVAEYLFTIINKSKWK